jgi:RecB family endonuclease NucS
VQYRVNPAAEEAVEFIDNNHRRSSERNMLTVVGDCRVEYDGRARSRLEWGERMLMCKSDGTVMVHGNTKREPLNWQPPQAVTDFRVEGEMLVVETVRNNPRERMEVRFRAIAMLSTFPMRDESRLEIVGEESDIVERILAQPGIVEEGLRIRHREKSTRSGSIDLFAIDSKQRPVIIEVKRSTPTLNAVTQLQQYIEDFREKNRGADVRGILVAPRISSMIRNTLTRAGLEYVEVTWELDSTPDSQSSLDSF